MNFEDIKPSGISILKKNSNAVGFHSPQLWKGVKPVEAESRMAVVRGHWEG